MSQSESFDRPLFNGSILKVSSGGGDDAPPFWRFAGIASDSSPDDDGTELKKSLLDINYLKQRGYVNWNHSREPADQIGYITKGVLLDEAVKPDIEKSLGQSLEDSATIYVEGQLYEEVKKAAEVRDIMKSSIKRGLGLGLSIDGLAKFDKKGNLTKAIVRGVAMTPFPAQTKTILELRKSLKGDTAITPPEGLSKQDVLDLVKSVFPALYKEAQMDDGTPRMSEEDAILWLCKRYPTMSYGLSTKIVRYVADKVSNQNR